MVRAPRPNAGRAEKTRESQLFFRKKNKNYLKKSVLSIPEVGEKQKALGKKERQAGFAEPHSSSTIGWVEVGLGLGWFLIR